MKLQHVPTLDSHQLHEPSDVCDVMEELSPLALGFKGILHAGESSSNVAAQHPPPAQHSHAPPQHFKFNRPKKKSTV
uniref:Uncharacterized protein n=1 Tax=Panagrolaimus superbus TaxID=310955 RepID=A0A914YL34_9BILA